MTIISSIDGPTRRVFLHADTVGTELHPMDIYREMRTLRRLDETLRQFDVFMIASGHVTKGPGKFTERLVTLVLGTRIVPFDATGELTIIGTIITDEGTEGVACFDRSSLSITTTVDINYVPPQVEVVEVNTGSGITPEDILAVAKAVWDFPTTLIVVSGSVGEYLLKQLLTFKQFIGLK